MILAQLTCIAGTIAHAAAATSLRDISASTTPPIIRLDYATYQGARAEGAAVDQFLGMRFARPPLADLRFRAPQEPVFEVEVQDATKVL